MPLYDCKTSVIDAFGELCDNVPKTITAMDSFHVGGAWAKIAVAFFSNGVDPVWTSEGLNAGEQAFAAAVGPRISNINDLFAGFSAFAALASSPANAVPVPPSILVSPPAGTFTLSDLAGIGNQQNHKPAGLFIANKLLAWAATGLVSTPAPVITKPWS